MADIRCMFPHVFIHYEGKIRIWVFLELCTHLMHEIDKSAFKMHEMLPKTPLNAAEARIQRQAYIAILQRCKDLEGELYMSVIPQNRIKG